MYLFTSKSLQVSLCKVRMWADVGYEAAARCSKWRAEVGTGRPAFWFCLACD